MIEFQKPKISTKKISDQTADFTIEPLERGFGHTLGSGLRRILLSSLPGAATTSVKIEGVNHEFSTIKGIREDVTDVILNLKKLVLKLHSDEPAVIKIKEKGPKEIKASDAKVPSEVEIINPDLHVATLNKDGRLEAEITVEAGRGYVSSERNKRPGSPIGVIPMDSLFTPVVKVSHAVGNTRVGQRTDYDKLTLHVETNGGITPKEAVSMAAKIMNEHMSLFIKQAEETKEAVFVTEEVKKDKTLEQPIENLELSVRSYNCLKRQGIDTLEQLANCSEADLLSMRNFGAKSIKEVKDKLAEMNLALK